MLYATSEGNCPVERPIGRSSDQLAGERGQDANRGERGEDGFIAPEGDRDRDDCPGDFIYTRRAV